MAYSLENTTDLTALGNAIRAKTGGSATMTVAEMATAVNGITTGGGGSNYTPNRGMTFEQTSDSEGNPVINIDLYGANQLYSSYSSIQSICPVILVTNIGNLIGRQYKESGGYYTTNYINITLHDNSIDIIPVYFLKHQITPYNSKIILNLADNTRIKKLSESCLEYCGKIQLPTNFFDSIERIDTSALRYADFQSYNNGTLELPASLKYIGSTSFDSVNGITTLIIHRDNLASIEQNAFRYTGLTTVYFIGNREQGITINSKAFSNTSNLTDIYVPWSEGDVANAPWGATNATIHYNWTPSE